MAGLQEDCAKYGTFLHGRSGHSSVRAFPWPLLIAMYHREHEPAHFHARYSGLKAIVRIADGYVTGKISPRAEALIREWWSIHRDELLEDWKLAKEGKVLRPIPPLE